MPARLRPTAPIAADAILVGDPGRALMLAQELLQQPKMSNHARGLWGYTGLTHDGHELTVQSTGMGGPSATVVLHDLAELGMRRAVRVGTCTSLERLKLGELVIVTTANEASPDRELTAALEENLGEEGRRGIVASLDVLHRHHPTPAVGADVADMQTAALFAAADRLQVAVAALLIVSETNDGESLGDEALEDAAKRAGGTASAILSP
ncbi:MAG: phosphorylase family protein [Solirubrobacterales bacterium]